MAHRQFPRIGDATAPLWWLCFLGSFILATVGLITLIAYINRPIGQDIVFVSVKYPHSEIHTIKVDGTRQHRLAYHRRLPRPQKIGAGPIYRLLDAWFPGLYTHPATEWNHSQPFWSPDGSQILFVFHGSHSLIYLMDADGGSLRPLATGWNPVWSPGGDEIAFLSNQYGPDHNIYIIKRDGSNLAPFTSGYTEKHSQTWSPDGDQIAFVSGYYRHCTIYKKDIDGSNLTPLMSSSSNCYYELTWSPNGLKIAFTSYEDSKSGIYLINQEGGELTRLTSGSDTDKIYHPTWSPDSSQIVFVTRHLGGDSTLSVINADGSNLRHLSDAVDWGKPSWSPDSSHITFSSRRDGHPRIYIINADGTYLKQLTFSDALDSSPSWRP